MSCAEKSKEMLQLAVNSQSAEPAGLRRHVPDETLIVIPCSGRKRNDSGSKIRLGTSILDVLPDALAAELRARRARNAPAAQVDESTLLAAADRYTGHLYRAAGTTLTKFVSSSASIAIISGGYGLVCGTEPIGWYQQSFRPAMWPNDLIGRCLAAYAADVKARMVVGLFAQTTGYAKAFRKASWPESVNQVFLVSPQTTKGAMVKSPRAQGEALNHIIRREELPSRWVSSDGLRMQLSKLK